MLRRILGIRCILSQLAKQGKAKAIVIDTGISRVFGTATQLAVNYTNNKREVFRLLINAIKWCCLIVIFFFIVPLLSKIKSQATVDFLLVLFIGGTPIAMSPVLSVTMAIGSCRLSKQDAIMKRMDAIEQMARMDVLCVTKLRTPTLNKLRVDRNLI